MPELLNALQVAGPMRRRLAALGIWAGFMAAMAGIAAVQAAAEAVLRFGTVQCALTLITVWAAWSAWHSALFGRARARLLQRGGRAYRTAFLRHIFPGITVGFSQMLRPAWNGVSLRGNAVFPQW